MRALSWKQPFAQLMLTGKIETRKWPTKYRGEVLICASQKGYTFTELINMTTHFQSIQIGFMFPPAECHLPTGVAIAVGTLVDCRRMTEADEAKTFVKYNAELWCHVYENVRPIIPIPFKGRQGWGKVTDEIKEKIKFV
jgi:hypothetical protein